MRMDLAMWLMDGRAAMLRRAESEQSRSAPDLSPASPHSGKVMKITTMDQLYTLFGGKGGPRGV